jgi:hypothetical protein
VALQCMDALTTLLFLSRGVAEGNPIINWALAHSWAPWTGLVLTKLIAAAIGSHCHFKGRTTLLRKVNAAYALVVSWNLVTLAATALAH